MSPRPDLLETSVEQFLSLPLDQIIGGLPSFLASYVTNEGSTRADIVDAISAVRADSSDWAELLEHMRTLGETYGPYRRNALAGRISGAYMRPLLASDSTLEGIEHLDEALALSAQGRRVMLVGNHLSYADTMSLRQMLGRQGRYEALTRIMAVAGPKVYTEPMRRLAVAGIHSIKVAQSSSLSTNEVDLSPREVVRIAREAMGHAEAAMDEGCFVLIYPEGTRSRTRRLQSFLKATSRWLSLPGVVLLPFAIAGSEALYSVDDDRMQPARCRGRLGGLIDTEAIRTAAGGGPTRGAIATAAWSALNEILPQDYQAEPGTPVLA